VRGARWSESPDAGSPSRQAVGSRRWITFTVLLLGVVSLMMLLAANDISERLIQRDSDRLRAIEQIQTALTSAHLWLEEHLTGDRVDPAEIALNLDNARGLIGAMLGEAPATPLDFRVVPLEDPSFHQMATSIRAGVETFRTLSIVRKEGLREGRDVGVGSELDAEYDALFLGLIEETREFESRLASRQTGNLARARALFRVIVASWIVIVALSVTTLWSLERRRAKVETTLRETDAQLHRAQRMDAIGRLAGGIAHDINSYLGAIRAQAELARDKAADDGTRRKTASILNSVAKASALIDRLLTFGRRQPVRSVAVNLNALLDDGVGAEIQRLVGENVRLERRLSADLHSVEIDPVQLEQVIVNLVANAVQAMPAGGRLRIDTANLRLPDESPRTYARPGDYVMLAVADTGSGIPPENRERIFEPFFTTKEASGHSGFGLATVYGAAQQAGGAVTVESDVGQGTTFRIYLRRARLG